MYKWKVTSYRVPELLFQPSMIGIEQAGIAETMDFVLKKFDAETQNKLAQVQYLHSFIMKNNILWR